MPRVLFSKGLLFIFTYLLIDILYIYIYYIYSYYYIIAVPKTSVNSKAVDKYRIPNSPFIELF